MIPMFFFVLVRVFLRFGRENVFSVAILEISGEKKIMSIFSVSAFASSNFAAATLAESVSKTSQCPASESHPLPMRSEEKYIRLQPISCCTNALLHLIFMVRYSEKQLPYTFQLLPSSLSIMVSVLLQAVSDLTYRVHPIIFCFGIFEFCL